MEKSIIDFCAWLAATPLSASLATLTWAIPLVQTIHILAISALIGSAVLFNSHLLSAATSGEAVPAIAARFLRWIWCSLPVLLVSGVIMIIAEPARELRNPVFRTKMLLILGAMVLTRVLQRPLRQSAASSGIDGARRGLAIALSATSLLLWVAVIFAGRLIAYDESANS
jgi:hypothetical protein